MPPIFLTAATLPVVGSKHIWPCPTLGLVTQTNLGDPLKKSCLPQRARGRIGNIWILRGIFLDRD